mmetsp:Transcript_24728/g.62175  ORF Transcript_24728/g.62175 Transcript_24728/m.62175 type:complete len:214 (+) Transcript_24728:2815-3456(+)
MRRPAENSACCRPRLLRFRRTAEASRRGRREVRGSTISRALQPQIRGGRGGNKAEKATAVRLRGRAEIRDSNIKARRTITARRSTRSAAISSTSTPGEAEKSAPRGSPSSGRRRAGAGATTTTSVRRTTTPTRPRLPTTGPALPTTANRAARRAAAVLPDPRASSKRKQPTEGRPNSSSLPRSRPPAWTPSRRRRASPPPRSCTIAPLGNWCR